MFTPTLDWGNELWASLVWIAKAWAIAAIATLDHLRPDRPFHRVGQAVLAHHRRLLHRRREPQGLAVARRRSCSSVIAGVRLDGAPQLPGQRHDDQLPGGRRAGQQRRQRRREGLRQRRLLLVDAGLLGPGRPVHRAADARHVHGAAVLPGVARVADRPAHRRLARRQGLLPGPVHRRQDRQPRSAHPGRHRHLHRRQRTAAQRSRTITRRTRCCSARSTPSPR